MPNQWLRELELHLWQAAKDTTANSGVLVKLFERIGSFFERLNIYTTEVQTGPALTDKLAKIMVEVLIILGIATKGIKERRMSGSIFRDMLLPA